MIPPLGRTIPDVLRERVLIDPRALPVISERGEASCEALLTGGASVASALRARGTRRGNRVGLVLTNRPEWIEILVGSP